MVHQFSAINVSPSLRKHIKRLQPRSHDYQRSQVLEPLSQAPHTPPSVHKRKFLKRPRGTSLQDSSPSKAPRQDGQDCISYDSEGFEMIEPVDLPTPGTVEIFNTSDTERPPTPDVAGKADVEQSFESDDSQSSKSPEHHIAFTSRSSGSLETKKNPAGPSEQSRHDSPRGEHDDCPYCCSEELLKSNLPDEGGPDLSPNTYVYVRNLGLHSPDGSFFEHWVNYPVSFVPSTSPFGPRDLNPGHYNCPYPGCIDPSGPYGRPDGYTGQGLALHIYRRHGYGPAVERVRLDLHKRVMILRYGQGKDSKDAPLPCCWLDPGRDLVQITVGLIQDLDEIRQWERSRRLVVSRQDKPNSATQATETDKPALPEQKKSMRAASTGEGEGKGKGKAAMLDGEDTDVIDWETKLLGLCQYDTEAQLELIGSPSCCARVNRFARLGDNRFQRPQGASSLHLKEGIRTPKYERDDIGDLLFD